MFKIVITEIKVVDTLTEKVWAKLDETASPIPQSAGKATWGYTPQEPCQQQVEIKRLEQSVDALDIAAVIRAINVL